MPSIYELQTPLVKTMYYKVLNTKKKTKNSKEFRHLQIPGAALIAVTQNNIHYFSK